MAVVGSQSSGKSSVLEALVKGKVWEQVWCSDCRLEEIFCHVDQTSAQGVHWFCSWYGKNRPMDSQQSMESFCTSKESGFRTLRRSEMKFRQRQIGWRVMAKEFQINQSDWKSAVRMCWPWLWWISRELHVSQSEISHQILNHWFGKWLYLISSIRLASSWRCLQRMWTWQIQMLSAWHRLWIQKAFEQSVTTLQLVSFWVELQGSWQSWILWIRERTLWLCWRMKLCRWDWGTLELSIAARWILTTRLTWRQHERMNSYFLKITRNISTAKT